jgi:hypothetical protein
MRELDITHFGRFITEGVLAFLEYQEDKHNLLLDRSYHLLSGPRKPTRGRKFATHSAKRINE